jgi:regulator of sirC expression with transglutaminase-like and TPR domain
MGEPIDHLGLVDDGEIELDRAALSLAAQDHPGADLAACEAQLDDIEDRLARRAAGADDPARQAARLAEVLAGECGFEGDRDTYDDAANADLIRVLERRRGLPIALSILYVAQARRQGWTAHALNTPSHVLIAVGDRRPVIMDPFNSGAVVSQAQLATLLSGALWTAGPVSSQHVAPMTNRATLMRLLMNQVTRAEHSGQLTRAIALLQRITAFAPSHSVAWWDRARLEQAVGDFAGARQSLTAMLETTRDPAVRGHVMRALDGLA